MKQSILVAALLAVAFGALGKKQTVPGVVTETEPPAPPMPPESEPLDILNCQFPNLIGEPDIEALFEAELLAAGITSVRTPVAMGECRARIIGLINEAGWTFTREHNYWRAEGPGLPYAYAAPLHQRNGHVVRLDGDASGKDPATLNGFGGTLYHVDTPAGLADLAKTLRQVAADQ